MTNSQKEFLRRKIIRRTLVNLLFVLLAYGSGWGQTLDRADYEFMVSGEQPKFPLAGGLNSPQFSAVDLNNDQLPDLHVFDRVGGKQLAFLNNGDGSDYPFRFAPEYLDHFPDLENWMLLRDYNGDGTMDIFAYSDQNFDGVIVYTGYFQNDSLRFERFQFDAPRNMIYVPRANGSNLQLYVSTIDYPAVDDVDCDGDLDILTFNLVGGYVEFYANQSVERGFGRDSLIYRLEDNCWGGFFESGVSNVVDLAENPGDCVDLLQNGSLETRHSGSTLLTFDADGDGDKELILGDISFDNINFLQNGGNCEQAWMNVQDPNFPASDVPAVVPVYPATFFLDVDQDGLRDLLVAPNAAFNASDREIWFYKNTGTEQEVDFQLVKTDFLVEEMVDLGSGARPVFFDYNADGLLDLIIGNYSFYEPFGEKNARLMLYENVGDLNKPAFQLVDDDYLNLNQFSQSAFAFTPSFGDLDGDGDLDAVIGEQGGRLFLVENTAGPGRPAQFAPAQYNYMDIFVGQASVPQIVDLNRDGLPDLVVGERNGNINYFQNKGTSGNPSFQAEPDQMVLGGVDTRIPGFDSGYSSPWFFEQEGAWQLLTGTQVGRLELYGGIDGNLSGSFNLLEETYGNVKEGGRTHPTLADLDGDGLLELAVGNFSGGLGIFQTDLKAGEPVAVRDRPAVLDDLSVWPNPAKDRLFLGVDHFNVQGDLSVYNSWGQLLYQDEWNGSRHEIEVGHWARGIYWVRLEDEHGIRSKRVILE